MFKNLWLALVPGIVLGSCSGLRQFPETSENYVTALSDLDPSYEATLNELEAASGDAAKQQGIRNRLIETRMAVIDVHFKQFVSNLAKENAGVDFGVAVAGIAAGGAGALVSQTASQILSAVSGGLAGAQAAYDKTVLYEQTLSALVAQMHASRKAIAAQIFRQWALGVDEYPLWIARRDLEAYEFAGSLPGAIVSTAADAKVKDQQAEQILLRKVTPEVVSDEAIEQRSDLRDGVDALGPDQAKDMVTLMGAAFPEVESFVAAQYPSAVRDQDADGAKAKTLLKRMITLTALTEKDRAKWRAALNAA